MQSMSYRFKNCLCGSFAYHYAFQQAQIWLTASEVVHCNHSIICIRRAWPCSQQLLINIYMLTFIFHKTLLATQLLLSVASFVSLIILCLHLIHPLFPPWKGTDMQALQEKCIILLSADFMESCELHADIQ